MLFTVLTPAPAAMYRVPSPARQLKLLAVAAQGRPNADSRDSFSLKKRKKMRVRFPLTYPARNGIIV